jgi:diguanylate cyclase (GGDEF)-like protein/PAS domain S-box-containing protein
MHPEGMGTARNGRVPAVETLAAGGLIDSHLSQLEQVIEQSGESIVVKDLDGVVTVWNREATALYGFTAKEAIGRTLRQLHATDLSEAEYARVLARIRGGAPTTETAERRKKNGDLVLVLNKTTPLFDSDGRLIGEITIARDVTAALRAEAALREAQASLEAQLEAVRHSNRKLAQEVQARRSTERALEAANAQLRSANEELQKRAFIDSLTGMPNRVLFEDRLAHAVARLERSAAIEARDNEKIAVLFVDLDSFKLVNDSFGHAVGDKVLIEVAQRLCRTMRTSDTVARLGGDEFVLLMESVSGQRDSIGAATRLLEALSAPLNIGGHQLEISASVGIALYPDHGGPAELLGQADAAMYAAKQAGGRGYTLFESRMDAGARDRLSLQNDLRHALERGELQLHYQPKIYGGPTGGGGQISGVEALLRWNHSKRGLIGPVVFIPIAERIGLIKSLGDWVIDEACRQIRAWADEGMRIPVAINLSVYQLRDPGLLVRIQKSLERHGVNPSQLLCEITESAAMADVEATMRVFEEMRRCRNRRPASYPVQARMR